MKKILIKVSVNRYNEKPYNGMTGEVIFEYINRFSIKLSKDSAKKLDEYNKEHFEKYTFTPTISKENAFFINENLNIE